MNVVIFGPPGAGKGTQANNLVKEFNLCKISTGDLLREEIKKKTKLGNDIENIINKGNLVSDDIINNLIENISSKKENYNKLIFDGYPRNLNQAKKLDILTKEFNQKISCVLSLNVDKETIVKRILGRQICKKCGVIFNEYFNPATTDNHSCSPKFLKKRSDDNEKTIDKRFITYVDKTLPILNYYKEQKLLYEINGKAEINEIYDKIRNIITSLET